MVFGGVEQDGLSIPNGKGQPLERNEVMENGPDSQLSGPLYPAGRTIQGLPCIEVRPLFQRVFPVKASGHFVL